MSIQNELAAFRRKNGFGEPAQRPCTVPVYTGCLLVPLPNIEARHRYLKYHDLHHMLTGFSVGRIGEGEVSAWELGTGSALASPLLACMNLIALSTGMVLQPKRMWSAFVRGASSRNLYAAETRRQVDADRWESVAQLRAEFVGPERLAPALRSVEFCAYVIAAMAIHALIAIPALVARVVTDIGLGYSFFQVIKPMKRRDLF